MEFFIGLLIGAAGGLVLGWIFLPEPTFIRNFFVKIGWAKPVAAPLPPPPTSFTTNT